LPHAPTLRIPWPRDLSETRLREFLSSAGGGGLAADAVIEVEGYNWCERAFCGCSQHPILGRFLPMHTVESVNTVETVDTEPSDPNPSASEAGAKLTGAAPTCSVCGGKQTPHPFYTYRWTPTKLLAAHLDRTLAEIGVLATDAVRLRGESDSRLFFRPLVKRDATATPMPKGDSS
jgi:hypothetical protein